MRMGKNKQGSPRNLFCGVEKGYTIVEVMIFLAISGMMFVMAAAMISGKQATAEFKQGMNATNDQIRQEINNVANGTFNAGGTCNTGTNANPLEADQGSNQGCIFLGEIIRFSTGSPGYHIYGMAGRQFITGSDFSSGVPTKLSDAAPSQLRSMDRDVTYKWGIQFTGAISKIRALAFIKSFTSTTVSGSQDVSAISIPINNTHSFNDPIDPSHAMVPYLLANTQSNVNVVLCFSDGGNQYGSITIGGGQSQRLTTSVQITGNNPVAGCT